MAVHGRDLLYKLFGQHLVPSPVVFAWHLGRRPVGFCCVPGESLSFPDFSKIGQDPISAVFDNLTQTYLCLPLVGLPSAGKFSAPPHG
mmetsp:Transcript_10977/g.24183  ORF Transcript_10977/g.24183 Transcript_10977/m.24183 type:complete len:88 (-) Transcript_10977:171-434(-)